MEIRPLADGDTEAVLDLNEQSVEALSPLDAPALAHYRSLAAAALVCEVDAEVAAFALAYAPGTAYTSINYLWHGLCFDDFFYLDRISVHRAFRRRGIATALYDALEQQAAAHRRMVCEVNSEPPNPESLAFHKGRGYLEIGHLIQLNGHVTVMLEKPL